MIQKERDRLVALKKAKKKLITQKQVAAELGERAASTAPAANVERTWRPSSDSRGARSAVEPQDCRGEAREGNPASEPGRISRFWADLGSRVFSQAAQAGGQPRDAAGWMIAAKLWRAKPKRVEKVHAWRPRRSRSGELVQWDTSEHDWLEGRGQPYFTVCAFQV